MKNHACGPDHDKQFFADLSEVMGRHSHLAKKYQVVCIDHETEILHVDFDKEVGVKRIEGRQIITEFKERAPFEVHQRPRCDCCGWLFVGGRLVGCNFFWC